MAEEKRIKVSADVTPLRQLRDEAVSVYREINSSMTDNSREMDKNLQQLREQLSLMQDRNELEKLLLDLKRQCAGIVETDSRFDNPRQIEPTTQVLSGREVVSDTPQPPSIEEQEVKTPSSEVQTPQQKIETQPEIRSERKLKQPVEPIYDEETNSLTWTVEPEEEEEKPKKKRKSRKKPAQQIPQYEEEEQEPIYDEETNSLTWAVRPQKPVVQKPVSVSQEIAQPQVDKEQIKELTQETLREINRHVENIDESITNTDRSVENIDRSARNIDESQELVDRSTRNIDSSVINEDRSVQNIDKSREENNRSVNETNEIIDRTNREIDESQESIDRSIRNIDESQESFDRSTRNIDESQENVNDSTRTVENSKESIDNSEKNENNSVLNTTENVRNDVLNRDVHTSNTTENIRNIERNVENIQENTAILKDKDPVRNEPIVNKEELQQPVQQNSTQAQQNNTESQREVVVKLDDNNLMKVFGSLDSSIKSSSDKIVDKLSDLVQQSSEEKGTDLTGVTRYLNTLADSISRIEDSVDEIVKEQARSGGRRSTDTSSRGGEAGILPVAGAGGLGGALGGLTRFLGPLAGAFSIMSMLNNVKGTLIQRDIRNTEYDLQSPMMGSIQRQATQTRLEGQNEADRYRWIPLVGDYLSRKTEMKYDALAEAQQLARQTRLGMEQNVMSYAQTMGVSNAQGFREMGQEGRYAARALGMDIGEYSARRAQLVRAGGGTFRGGDETDPTAVRETQSLMAAEKLYGLRGVDQLQQVMRFGDRNENLGSSAVIKSFERAMERLNLSFSEIASTLDESLQTFTSEANKILEKRGDFDSATLAATLAGVKEYTGFSGRQLESVQKMATGSSLAEDDVTNAIVMRAIQQNTSARTFSEAMAQKESLADNPELMRSVLTDAQSMTSTNEQFMQMLNKMFTNLSWSTLQDLSRQGGGRIDIDALFEMIEKNKSEVGKQGEEKGIRQTYEKTAAEGVVGTEMKIAASDRDSFLGAIKAVKEAIEALNKKDEEYKEAVKEATVNVVKPQGYNGNMPAMMNVTKYMQDLVVATVRRLID